MRLSHHRYGNSPCGGGGLTLVHQEAPPKSAQMDFLQAQFSLPAGQASYIQPAWGNCKRPHRAHRATTTGIYQGLYKARLQTPALGHARVLLSQTSLNKHQITNKIILVSPPARRYPSPPRIGVTPRAQPCPTCVSGCSAYPWVLQTSGPEYC